MFKDTFVKSVFKTLAEILLLWLACHLTFGYAIIVLLLVGVWAISNGRMGYAFMALLIPMFFIMVNGYILHRDVNFAKIVRIFSLIYPIMLLASPVKKNKNARVIPILGLIPYLCMAFISSISGWEFLISTLKLFSFTMFIITIYLFSQMLDGKYEDILKIRSILMALSIILVWGSIVTLPFPSIAYYVSLRGTVAQYGLEVANYMYDDTMMGFLSGVAVHSQFLGPMLAFVAAYAISDMLFVEKKMKPLHLIVLVPTPILLYMTRSRIGLVVYTTFVLTFFFYALPKVNVSQKLKYRLRAMVSVLLFILIVVIAKEQYQNQTLSKMLRKTNDTEVDNRSLTEAVTASRQGTIELCMKDFKRNPMLGMGFQVTEQIKYMRQAGRLSLFSAPIEKGVTPLMILGETGIVGSAAFIGFLIFFFVMCNQKNLVVTATMMVTFLVANMAEATFFSPGGGGGVEWYFAIVGGFALDLAISGQPDSFKWRRRA